MESNGPHSTHRFSPPGATSYGSMVVLAVLAGSPLPALAGPGGDLDPTFGDNGRLVFDRHSWGRAVAQQPGDGRLLIAGGFATEATGSDFVVVRLNPDGSLDETFGEAGVATVDFTSNDESASNIALLEDGRILLAGTIDSLDRSRYALARLLPDGSLDPTFGTDGRVTVDPGGLWSTLAGLALEEDGSMVIAGTTARFGNHDAVFARLAADGTLDTSFGPVAGFTYVDSGIHDFPESLARQADGKYIACGSIDTSELVSQGRVLAVRLNPDGSVDPGFGTNGVWIGTSQGMFSAALDCMPLADGTILLAGYRGVPGAVSPVLLRLRSDGSLDTSTWINGMTELDIGDVSWARSVTLLEDGAYALTGFMRSRDSNEQLLRQELYVARVEPESGLLDPSFGDNGITIVDFGSGSTFGWSEGYSLVRQSDGKLVAAGYAIGPSGGMNPEAAIAVARIDPGTPANAGFVGVTDQSVEAREGAAQVTVILRRTGGSTGPVSVDFSTIPHSATAPADYVETSGTVTWEDGDMEPKSLNIQIVDDSEYDPDELFQVSITSSTVSVSTGVTTIFIADNETRPDRFADARRPGQGGGAAGPGLFWLLGGLALLRLRRARRCL